MRNQAEIDGTSGILFGLAPDWSQFYSFEIYPTYSAYGIYRHGENGWSIYAEGYSDNIRPYPASNNLKIERRGGQIWAYVNEQLMNVINETYYTSSGYLGLLASSIGEANYDARFDNFTVYPISCGTLGSHQSGYLDMQTYNNSQVDLSEHHEGIFER